MLAGHGPLMRSRLYNDIMSAMKMLRFKKKKKQKSNAIFMCVLKAPRMAPRVEVHNFQNAYALNACFLDDRNDALRESPPKLREIRSMVT